MKRSIRYQAVRWLVAVLALSLLMGYALPASAGPLDQSSGRIAVVVFPDLAGDGPGAPDCLGCDGDFLEEDSEANTDDPLPELEVVLRDASGIELDRNTTNGLANGRQVTFFTVQEIADYDVELLVPDEAWEACPDSGLELEVGTSDFDANTGIAAVNFFLWNGCDAELAEEEADAADEEADEAVVVAPEEADEADTEEADEADEADEAGGADDAMAEDADADDADVDDADVEDAAADEADEPEDAALDDDADDDADDEAVEAEDDGVEVDEDEAAADDEVDEMAMQPLGGIQGLVYMDLNGDGAAAPDEPGVSMVPVHLEADGQTQTQSTTATGNYTFADLDPGTYAVYIDVPAGYELTTNDRHSDIEVDGDIMAGLDFGLVATAGTTEVPATTTDDAESMPETGVQLHSTSGMLVALAAVVGLIGALGLAVESRIGRRTHARKDG